MMKTFFYSFCLFLTFCLQIFGSSFDELDESVRLVVLDQHRSHKKTVDCLRDGLSKLEFGYPAEGGASGGAGKASSSHKSGSTKSSKSVTQNWGDVNFAVGSLIVIKEDGVAQIIPIQGVGVRQSDNAPTIYDSCSDRTCNMLQDVETCRSQWVQYLKNDARILDHEGVEKVRGWITEAREDSPLRAIKGRVEKILETSEFTDIRDFSSIGSSIEKFQGYTGIWVARGWHSEQRLIYDLDAESIKDSLREIHSMKPIQRIVGCVYSYFSPCCLHKPEHPTCECMRSLQNWPERWTFIPELEGIEILMTASWSEDHESLGSFVDDKKGKFFVKKLGDEGVVEDVEIAAKYLQVANLNRQMGFVYRTINSYERRVYESLKPLIDFSKSHLDVSCCPNVSNKHDVRDLLIVFKKMGGTLLRTVDKDGAKILGFSSFPFSVSAAKFYVNGAEITFDPESDWNIWLSALFLCLSSSV